MPEPGASTLVATLLARLPQTQCAACGYPGCEPYARALVRGEAGTQACTPGGLPLGKELGRLLGREATAVPAIDAAAVTAMPPPMQAVIREADCIGCTKCIPPCPVDAILGAARQLHTVISAQCTGCGLCLAPCPVDCIELEAVRLPFTWPVDTTPAALAVVAGPGIGACTRCGDCVPVCPSRLAPAALARAVAAADLTSARELGLRECTECGHCGTACPVDIPLVAYFVQGKAMLAAVDWQAEQARASLYRQTQRTVRLEAAVTRPQQYVATPTDKALARDEIAAVRERARQRRTSSGHEG